MHSKEYYIDKYGEEKGISMYHLSAEIKDVSEYMHRDDIPLPSIKEPVNEGGVSVCVNPYAMDSQAALVLYIIVMLVGVIFVDRWFIWIAATVIYIRHKRQWKKKLQYKVIDS